MRDAGLRSANRGRHVCGSGANVLVKLLVLMVDTDMMPKQSVKKLSSHHASFMCDVSANQNESRHNAVNSLFSREILAIKVFFRQ